VERNEEERAAFIEELTKIPEEKRVYIDESGKNTNLDREYGYAPRGKLVEGKTSGKKADKLNIVAAKRGDKIIEPHEYNCAMNSRLFVWFMLLLKCAEAGSVFIMDNARFHRKDILRGMAEAANCRVLFLPAYSPDLNPIEHVWANLKTFLRNYGRHYSSVQLAIYNYFKSA
jgi:transposase